jgi:hypothetical protein
VLTLSQQSPLIVYGRQKDTCHHIRMGYINVVERYYT